MAGRKLLFVAVAAATFAAGASAYADPKPATTDSFTVHDSIASDANQWSPQIGRRSLQWDSKQAKWGLKLDMDQQLGLPQTFTNRDVNAGAFFKITPGFRVGGSVRLGAMNDGPQPATIPTDTAPKVRLETALKF
ncbi:MAG TPA: hypothetical protein VHX64_11970 [Caulobacteraceae bacterium]|nr:hypothetical protein [Caulobacteraceae bacterium]